MGQEEQKKISKVIYNGQPLIDLTGDTVDANHLLIGYTAHGSDGEIINGSCNFDAYTSDATAIADEILATKTAYKNGQMITGSMTNNGAVTGSISTKAGEYTVPQGYHDGSGKVSIASAEQEKIVAQNIRQGITILGVEGSMSGTEDVNAGETSITPTSSSQTVAASSVYKNVPAETTFEANKYYEKSGSTYTILTTKPNDWDTDCTVYYIQCNYISQVTVNAIPYTEADNAAGGKTVTIG